jgi:hypothetical protein
MVRIDHLLRRDWDEIGQKLLLAAVDTLAGVACKRANAKPETMRIECLDQNTVILSVSDKTLVAREEGDAAMPPRPFFAPSAEDRRVLHDVMTERLREDMA